MRIIKEIRENGSKRVATLNDQPSKTDQQYKEDCDANNIIRKFNKTGLISHVSRITSQFADVSDVPDLLEGMERIQQAKDEFLMVPAKIRAKFDNSVSKFYEYVANPENKDSLIELGLMEKPKNPDVTPKQPVAPPAKAKQEAPPEQ